MTLLDTYHDTGSDLDSLRPAIQSISDITHILDTRGRSITFLSLCTLPSQQADGKVVFYNLDKLSIDDFLEGKPFHIVRIQKDRIPNAFLSELQSTTGLAMLIDNKLYLVSDMSIPTLTLRASVSGKSTISRQNLIRDMHLADAIISKNEPIHLVYRSEMVDGYEIRKVFAAFGSGYRLTPQSLLLDVVDQLQEDDLICRSWSIGHDYTKIRLDCSQIPHNLETGSLLPGITLQTSDIGLSSLTIRSILRDPETDSYVILQEHTCKHSAVICRDDIISTARDILPKTGSVPSIISGIQSVLQQCRLPAQHIHTVISDISAGAGSADDYVLVLRSIDRLPVDTQTKDRARRAIGMSFYSV